MFAFYLIRIISLFLKSSLRIRLKLGAPDQRGRGRPLLQTEEGGVARLFLKRTCFARGLQSAAEALRWRETLRAAAALSPPHHHHHTTTPLSHHEHLRVPESAERQPEGRLPERPGRRSRRRRRRLLLRAERRGAGRRERLRGVHGGSQNIFCFQDPAQRIRDEVRGVLLHLQTSRIILSLQIIKTCLSCKI